MARVFVTRELPFGALDRLRAEHDVEVWPERLPPPREALEGHEGLLTMLTDPVDAELMAASPGLRAISNYAVGVDNVDVEAATARGIPVGNTPGVLTESTADLAVALMLALMRRLAEGEAAVREGEWLTWEPARLLGRDLHRSTVLVVGPGRIGAAVRRRVEGFGATVIEARRGDALGPLLAEADVVTLHCPLTDETRGLIGARRAGGDEARGVRGEHRPRSHRRPGGAGGRAARRGDRRRRARRDRPRAAAAGDPLLGAPNLLVVPHVASATHATRAAMADIAVDNLLAALRGEPMPHWCESEALATRREP